MEENKIDQLKMLGKAYLEQKKLQKDIANTVKKLKNDITDRLHELGVSKIKIGEIKITHTPYYKMQLNTKEFKKAYPDIYNEFGEDKEYWRLTVSEVEKKK